MRRSFRTATAIAATIAPLLAQPAAAAETMPKFYVYGEDDSPADLRGCRVSHAAAIVVVEAELRKGGVVIQTDSKAPEAVMDTYLNISAMPIASSPQNCTYNFELNFESFNEVPNPFTSASEFTKLSYCSKGSLMIWEKSGAQQAINDKLREYARECLNRYRTRTSR